MRRHRRAGRIPDVAGGRLLCLARANEISGEAWR